MTAAGHSTFKGRLEDKRMTTGAGRYASDWNLPGQAYAYFLRADRAHAEIMKLDCSVARAHPGVIAVLTGDDVDAAGMQSTPANIPRPGRGGMALRKPHRPVLAQGRVRYVGEPVAIVVAESAAIAQDATEMIQVEYRDLPTVTAGVAALGSGSPLLHEVAPNNIAFEFEAGSLDAAQKALQASAHRVSICLDNARAVGSPLEPRACLAVYEPENENFVLHACTQGAQGHALQIAGIFKIPGEKVTVIAREVGGGFGVRNSAYPEECAALLAARITGRAVKWVGTRSEMFVSDTHARDVVALVELGLDENLRFTAMQFRFIANVGAYLSPTGGLSNSIGVLNCITGVYDVQAAGGLAFLGLSNKVPTGAYRGAGRPIMSYMLERVVDQAAVELKVDPAELRRKNFIPVGKFPYKLVSGSEYDNGEFEVAMDKALAAADWKGFAKRREQSRREGKLRGRGLATPIEASGAGFTPFDAVEIRFDSDANVAMFATSQNQGQGHETVFAQLVSAVFGVPMESISLHTAERGMKLAGGGSGGSRTLAGIGNGLRLVALQVVEKGKALAAQGLECAAADIDFSDGDYRVSGTDRRIDFANVVKKFAPKAGPHPLDTYYEAKTKSTYPYGCHIAEVEIDPETGETEIVSYVACDDSGTVVNHQIVEGQVMGGLTQGSGQIMGEHAFYDPETGQLLSGS
ncbi:MAG: xanthine dehydrogenase family protein molybdopterin-binding subunit [Betaproteobacteria bacterium]|nr:xanthine dehydrogenase family protein molybdopterin-binding subunit [Betaproteobacteria bacterium]